MIRIARFSTFRSLLQKSSFKRLTADEVKLAKEIKAQRQAAHRKRNIATATYYAGGTLLLALTVTYASVPLYRAICTRTGYAGIPVTDNAKFTPERMQAVDRKERIRVQFSSEVSSVVPWVFKPEQHEVHVLPGETALAFYKAKNVGPDPVIGMATYTVVPERAAAYFSKIQCFCFEEQLLMPGEEVDMPLFFFIDPDFARDPAMAHIHEIVLHYTFFKAHYQDKEEEKQVIKDLTEQFART